VPRLLDRLTAELSDGEGAMTWMQVFAAGAGALVGGWAGILLLLILGDTQ
jgi:hypothetical protein